MQNKWVVSRSADTEKNTVSANDVPTGCIIIVLGSNSGFILPISSFQSKRGKNKATMNKIISIKVINIPDQYNIL